MGVNNWAGQVDLLSIFVAAVPFAFALVRAVRTGYDLRYFWVALASLLGAMATIAVGRAHVRRPIAFVALVAGVFVIATLLAVFAALLIGTTLGLGIIAVGAAFGFSSCSSRGKSAAAERRRL